MKYEIHYEYDYDDEKIAAVNEALLTLMMKLKIVVSRVLYHQSHSGDITLSVEYSIPERRKR